ncbi:MAG: M61 family peptidase [Bacteroidota bacterium]
MRYLLSYNRPHDHFIDIEFIADQIKGSETLVQLPSWRPGRYELGNFAKNVQKWAAYDEQGNALAFRKVSKDCWKVQTRGVKELHIRYNYYAAELNAGSSFLDETQLYVNPVNCCVFIPDRIGEACTLELALPESYKVACGMKEIGKNIFEAKDFHELADSPFIASNTLQHNLFVLDGVEFNLWFQGECKPEWTRLINDFFIFISEQFLMMKECPVEVYHFFFQILPYRFYHGVEHLNSTVIALGPSYNLMKGELYDDLLGVSSHELFHAWNIKSIRPAEMYPYDYTRENYSRLGYVCEGITTYYGDLLLYRSGVFSEAGYLKTVHERLQKHMDNFGRYNLSVADSSFDTWLDGYAPGIPNRKTSIYDEGSLLAFMTDIAIRRTSENRNSLDDVMRCLYFEYAKKGRGYSEADYKKLVEDFAENNMDNFFAQYVNGAASYENAFKEALDYIGCELMHAPAKKFHERFYGFKASETGGTARISAIYPGSVADLAELSTGDEILMVNNMQVKPEGSATNLNDWLSYFGKDPVKVIVANGGLTRIARLAVTHEEFYRTWYIRKKEQASESQKTNYRLWSKHNF